ncbi:hypothetical protein D8674_008762 [Pyrus ussuriensis x Pyrus communis]|uniref:S2-RNase n=1 Tax=Pyrus ussuriensis x Pyrus communis TaxID=2448454 RepID=A0A5N5HWR6_9ROSA|nr:hypothetical protein D8674_008762 [Pyrus ussuriensis x Pyrus communis]
MAPRSKRNTIRTGNSSDAGEPCQESQEHLDEYDMPDIIATIHALGEAQKEIVADKYWTLMENASQEDSVAEDVIAMLEKEPHKSSEDWKYLQSYNTSWPQAKGWGDEDANLMDFAPSLSDEVFTIDMPEEYNEGALEVQLFNQEMMAINDVFIRQALVNTGSSVNIVPLAMFTAASVPTSKVLKSKIFINGFGNNSDETMGYIEIDLKICPMRFFTKFYVMDINVVYHALLGRPWINKHRFVPSTYCQCMPFNLDEVHYSYTECYNDFSSIRKVRDLSDQEFLAIVEKGKRIQPDTDVFAYTLPQSSKVVLPNDRIVYLLW